MVAREEEFGDEDTRRGMQQRRVICGFGFVTNRHAGIFSDTGCAKWTKTNGRVARRTWLTTNGLIADVGFFFTKRFDRHRFLVLTNRYPEEMRIILSLSRFFQIAGETMKNSNDLGSTIEEMSKYDVFSLSLESICTISSLFFSLFRISRDPRIRMAVWNRGYEDTIRDRQDRKISRVSFFFCCRNKRPRVRPWTCPSVRARSAIQCNRLEQKRIHALWRGGHQSDGTKEAAVASAILPSPCSSSASCSLGYHSHSSAVLLINLTFFLDKNLILLLIAIMLHL